MQYLLSQLAREIASFENDRSDPHPQFDAVIQDATVAFAVGGQGSRLKHITQAGVQKSSFRLPNGETMIERSIRMFADIGVKDFVALVYHEADSVIKLLGDGSAYGVTVRYSHDPGKPIGRGGALRHALEQGILSDLRPLIVHNPDDQLVGDVSALLRSIISRHLYSLDQGLVASVVVVPGTPYPYSGMMIERGKVIEVTSYPFIPVPAHIGMTLFSPRVFEFIRTLFDTEHKRDFENILLPVLAKERLLAACPIPYESWIPVNDEKGLEQLIHFIDHNA